VLKPLQSLPNDQQQLHRTGLEPNVVRTHEPSADVLCPYEPDASGAFRAERGQNLQREIIRSKGLEPFEIVERRSLTRGFLFVPLK
jgi:hypothetical protein